MTKLRPLALGAAVTIGFGSLFLASPAFAEGTEATAQDPTMQAFAAGAELEQQTGIEDLAVGAGTNADGEAVLFIDAAEATDDVKKAANKLDAKVALVGAAVTDSATDVVGGAGYMSLVSEAEAASCSIGFSAFTPTGDAALITAGHCSSDGALTDVYLTQPSTEPAEDGPGYKLLSEDVAGKFGFSQFGGPNNSVGAEDNPTSTDIAVIDITNGALELHAEVTDWTTAAEDDLAASTTKITGVADPVSGTVSKSGRTTGLTTGDTTLDMLYTDGELYPTEILDGYMEISGRWVHGFIGGALTDPGDSGGAVFQGTNAVGVVSGGPREAPAVGEDWAWYTRLADALEYTNGYQVAIYLDAPTVDGPTTVEPGGDIVVTVPAPAETLTVTTGPDATEDVSVVDGQVTLQAPAEEGTVNYMLTAKQGFNTSETTTQAITVDHVVPRPTIDALSAVAAEGDDAATINLTGTGVAGADVKINDIWDTTVDADGTWTYANVSFGIGDNVVTATQTVDGEASAERSATITVSPAVPGVVSIKPNQTFSNDDAPSQLSGTGLADADVKVTLDGKPVASSAVAGDGVAAAVAQLKVNAGGKWTVDLGGKLAAGTHTVTASQTFNGVASAATTVVFTVETAPVVPVEPTDPVDPVAPTEPTAPVTPTAPGEQLPETGGVSMMPIALTAFGLLVLGGGATLLAARKLKPSKI